MHETPLWIFMRRNEAIVVSILDYEPFALRGLWASLFAENFRSCCRRLRVERNCAKKTPEVAACPRWDFPLEKAKTIELMRNNVKARSSIYVFIVASYLHMGRERSWPEAKGKFQDGNKLSRKGKEKCTNGSRSCAGNLIESANIFIAAKQ